MKCVMCDKFCVGGVLIFGISSNYKVCAKCLDEHHKEFKITNYSTKNKHDRSIQRKKCIQKMVDEKLNYYLGG